MNHIRLELRVVAQQRLRHHPLANTGHLFEIERAIDEIQGGCACSHTETVERWCVAYLDGVAA